MHLSYYRSTIKIRLTSLLVKRHLADERMFLGARHVPPLVVIPRILDQQTVLVSGHVVGLPGVPVGVIERDGVSLTSPRERMLFVKVVPIRPKSAASLMAEKLYFYMTLFHLSTDLSINVSGFLINEYDLCCYLKQ